MSSGKLIELKLILLYASKKAIITYVYLCWAERHGHGLWECHTNSSVLPKSELFKRKRTGEKQHPIGEDQRLHASSLGP